MENKAPNEIVRGHINTIILSSLIESDKYGYEIRKEIEAKSSGSFVLKEPTLYSSLKRLEKQGFVEAYYGESDETNGGRRKYYKLTEYGREITLKNLNEWKYSRSLIDKLITEEKVDLKTASPPEDLNLNLTKKVSKNYEKPPKEVKDVKDEGRLVFETQELPENKKDPVIKASQIQQNMFETDKIEMSDKEYKNLMSKLISSTKSHSVTDEKLQKTEKEVFKETVREKETSQELDEKVSYSLLHKGGASNDTSFIKTQKKIQDEGFKLRTYTVEKTDAYRQFVLINKLLLSTFILTYLTMIIELLIVGFVFEKEIKLGISVYIIIGAVLLALPLAGLILWLNNKDKKVKAKLDLKALILYSLLIFGIAFIAILGINLIINPSFVNLKDVVVGFVFPALAIFNILPATFYYGLLYRSQKFMT